LPEKAGRLRSYDLFGSPFFFVKTEGGADVESKHHSSARNTKPAVYGGGRSVFVNLNY
jgi:hypothetical protein